MREVDEDSRVKVGNDKENGEDVTSSSSGVLRVEKFNTRTSIEKTDFDEDVVKWMV